MDQAEIDFENEGGETYICGNPPYKGARKQEACEKQDFRNAFGGHSDYKDADYVIGWFLKASEFALATEASFSLVATSSICQGEQVQFLWPRIWANGQELFFAYTPFKWSNNASENAGVFVNIVGVRMKSPGPKLIFDEVQKRHVDNISPYITRGPDVVVRTAELPLSEQIPKMIMGNMARDEGHLIMSREEANALSSEYAGAGVFLKPLVGTKELVNGVPRFALHLDLETRDQWARIPPIQSRVDAVRKFRQSSRAKTTNGYANVPHRFAQYCHREEMAIALPSVTPENRTYVTPVILPPGVMVTNLAYLIYGCELSLLSLLSSRMHAVWITAVSGRLGAGIRYTPSISYHTFPVPNLLESAKRDLMQTGRDILVAREASFPATIAEMYDPEFISDELAAAHERNDEVLERAYIGRRFRNDTERLEKLFELYIEMSRKPAMSKRARAGLA
ncbi:MAG: hypothetical protein IT205_07060 [Fimbriimonadaceae bacterium]|nr:hypothetical protein [Fimbriimonadaceae bacterium]